MHPKGRVNKPIFGQRVSRNLRDHLRWTDRAGIAAAGSSTDGQEVGWETKKGCPIFISASIREKSGKRRVKWANLLPDGAAERKTRFSL